MQDNIDQKPIAIRFTRNLDLKIIDCTKPIPFEADRFIKDDAWSDEALSNCVALVPVTYIEAGEYIKCLPRYIPIYSWGYGSSTIDITRTYKNEPVWFRLVGDITWAKISQSISSNYREHRKESVNMPGKQKPQISTEHKVISYPEAFFYDVINQVRIDEESNEQHHNIEVIYNSFKDALEMDADSKISVTRNKMLTLTYFQLFMMIMHYMNFFWKVRMTEEDPGPENVTYAFHEVLIRFCKHAYHVRNYPNDVSTWDELEIDLNSIRNEVSTFVDLINSYFYEADDAKKQPQTISVPPPTPGMYQQIVMNKDGTPFRMPPDEDETEDNEPGENLDAKFREQECMQDMDLSRAHWAAEKIMLVVRTSMNICVLITLVFVVARMWALILSSEEKYKFTDAELGSIILTLIIITIITNIKTIFGWFKELSHG